MKHTKSAPSPDSSEQVRPEVSAGLPGASPVLDRNLRKAGIDPDRLSILHLGLPAHLHRQFPAWMKRMLVGYALWLVLFLLKLNSVAIPPYLEAVFYL
ncbi:MAG: hypothetical protein ABJH28_18585 [Paraglaciecola sp.]|uniref:hypothetical protein n=1 Tax=Paraglaciecola sp. TaxID=1920173 RepID=UPI00326641A0